MRMKLVPLAVILSLLCAMIAMPSLSLAAGQKSPRSRSKSRVRKTPKARPIPQREYETVKITSERELELGMKLPGTPPKMFTPITQSMGTPSPDRPGIWYGGGPIIAGLEAEWAGVKGMIGADTKTWVITYISTSDLAFVTPEGLRVGDSAEKVLKVSGGEVIKENDYVFYVRLPSGWHAKFEQVEYDANGKLIVVTNGRLKPDTKVVRFYKK